PQLHGIRTRMIRFIFFVATALVALVARLSRSREAVGLQRIPRRAGKFPANSLQRALAGNFNSLLVRLSLLQAPDFIGETQEARTKTKIFPCFRGLQGIRDRRIGDAVAAGRRYIGSTPRRRSQWTTTPAPNSKRRRFAAWWRICAS